VPTKDATSVCSPSTLAIDPTRDHRPENEEGRPHPLYAYLYVTDRQEGLIVIGNRPRLAGRRKRTTLASPTLLDGNPENNFLERAATFNPGGLLNGARSMTLNGPLRLRQLHGGPGERSTWMIRCIRGVTSFLGRSDVKGPRKVAVAVSLRVRL